MASNLRTPRSILHAPKIERTFLVETKGASRRDRRAHAKGTGYYKRTPRFEPWKGKGVRVIQHPAFREAFPSQNEPYVRPAEPKDDNVSGSWLRRWRRRKRST